jgi:hypothetical protein
VPAHVGQRDTGGPETTPLWRRQSRARCRLPRVRAGEQNWPWPWATFKNSGPARLGCLGPAKACRAWETPFLYSINFQLIPTALDLKIQNITLLESNNFQTWHGGISEPVEQISPLAQLEIAKEFHVINFGTKINLNLP